MPFLAPKHLTIINNLKHKAQIIAFKKPFYTSSLIYKNGFYFIYSLVFISKGYKSLEGLFGSKPFFAGKK